MKRENRENVSSGGESDSVAEVMKPEDGAADVMKYSGEKERERTVLLWSCRHEEKRIESRERVEKQGTNRDRSRKAMKAHSSLASLKLKVWSQLKLSLPCC